MPAPSVADPTTSPDAEALEVLIVGAGFGGLCMAIQLLARGERRFLVLEGDEVGGTWRDNQYPGAECDVQSHLYSYSFAPKPDWSRRYAGWEEIQRYILDTTERHGVRPYARFRRRVTGLHFDAGTALWRVVTESRPALRARHVVLATGPLHVPQVPRLAGLERFKGRVFHSARWDQACDFAGKHVASIGTGGSAIQYCPRIAPLVARLDVYQRTPAWVIPRDTRRYSDGARRRFTRFDAWRRLHRARLYWTNESRVWPIFHPGLARVQAGLRDTVWSTWCRSWYQQDDGRNFTIWPWSTWRYWLETRRVDASRYRFGKATVAAAVLAASLAMSACSGRSSPEVQVRAVIEAAEDAAERRDHAELMALVSPEFSGAHGEDVRDVSQQVRGYLLAHPSVHVATRIDGIEFPYEDMARVQLTVGTLGGDASTLELSADAQSVELELQNEGGEWRVTRAGWEPVLER